MKIKTRNRFITLLMILSLALIVINALACGYQIYTGNFHGPDSVPQAESHFIFQYSFPAVIASIFISFIYIFIMLLYIDVEFEKTQSTEIIFISLFLLGFLAEGFRILTPLLNLWNSVTILSSVFTRVYIWGRTLVALSLLFSVIYSNFESRQYVEQNILIVIAASILIAYLIPLNTGNILSTGIIKFGFGQMFQICQHTVLFVSIICITIKDIQNHQRYKLVLGFSMLIIGYATLSEAKSIFEIALGTVLLFSGSFTYLKSLHKQYLWN